MGNKVRAEASSHWLNKARRDSDTAFLNDRHGGYTDVTCYFSHQTVEKSLKAFLIYHSIRYPKTHNLSYLLKICIRKDKSFGGFSESCKFLNRYYIEAKYPVIPPIDYPKKDAKEAIKGSVEILEFVTSKISKVKK